MKKTYINRLLALAIALAAAFTFTQAQTLTVDGPASVAGEYNVGRAGFGPRFGASFSGMLVDVIDTNGLNTACVDVDNAASDVAGAVALINRGVCGFAVKALNAQDAGAVGVVICNNDTAMPDAVIAMGGSDGCELTIPAVMLSFNDCQALRMESGVMVSYNTPSTPPAGFAFETAIEVGPGTYTVDSIPTNGNTFTNATGELWYKYTAPEDGVLSITSCDSDVATRVIITTHPLGCAGDLNIYNSAINNCPDSDGSVRDIIVLEGVSYYLVWDNAITADGFDFTLSQGALPAVPITFSVDMNQAGASPDGVNMVIAGPGVTDVGDVVIVPMSDDDGDGVYTAVYEVATLDTIGYAFVNGAVDPANIEIVPEECGLNSGFGFNIRPLINNAIEPFSVSTVCFSSCGACPVIDLTCENPQVLIFDDFESYTAGQQPTDADYMILWPTTTSLGIISEDVAFSGTQSHRITGTGADVDPVYLLGNQESGQFIVSWRMYVAEGSSAYYNFQKDEAAGTEWAFQLHFDPDGTARLEAGSANAANPRATFEYQPGTWLHLRHIIDMDNNIARLIVDREVISSWPYNWQPFAQTGLQRLGGVNFYPSNAGFLYYIDDFSFVRIPDAAEGLYCQTATPIDEGVHTVDQLSCFGGGYFIAGDETSGLKAAWYSYTATEDGYISVSSCGGGADSRVWIFSGDCTDIDLQGVNDDRCDIGNGNAWAAYREAVVTAGTTYYIMWDDIWEDAGFDFELAFVPGALPEGNFCQSAEAVDPGTHTVTSFGDASVGGPFIGNLTSSTTPYAGGAWYSYTPNEDGLVDINSCGTDEDTYLFVYTGTCDNIGSLELVALNDDACAAASSIEGLEVTAGTTYYIEWIDLYDDGTFDWELVFRVPTVSVTLNVDMSLEEVSPNGVHVAGSFQGWDPSATPLTDNGDGTWSVTIDVEPNAEYEYKFINDNTWDTNMDERNIGSECGAGDSPAGLNRLLVVGSEDFATPVYCFDYCITCQEVSVDDKTLQQGVSIFPNPARDLINVQIDLPETATNLNIRLVNALGQEVMSRNLGRLQSDNIELDIRQLPAGSYMLQLIDGTAQFTQSVIIK